MKVYKIKHIPTGLFFQPVRGRFGRDQSHLSTNGKLYHKKPSLDEFSEDTYSGTRFCISNAQLKKYPNVILQENDGYSNRNLLESFKDHWQVVTYELKEVKE